MRRESDWISRFRQLVPAIESPVEIGIGDDAALISPSSGLAVTVDSMVEGRHFDLGTCKPEFLGDKLLTASVSDLIVKGSVPRWCLVSLAIHAGISDSVIDAIYEGLTKRATEVGVTIAGGNLTRSSHEMFLDLFLAGDVSRDSFKRRSGAKIGDRVAVLGPLGDSAAGLEVLRSASSETHQKYAELVLAHLRPRPPIDATLALVSEEAVHATIDISDGLSSELFHLRESSKVGFLISEDSIPLSAAATSVARDLGKDSIDWAWSGGEDYRLLFTFDPGAEAALRAAGHAFDVIGEVTPFDRGMIRRDRAGGRSEIDRVGWDPFSQQ